VMITGVTSYVKWRVNKSGECRQFAIREFSPRNGV
jgi:hypothetical protein